MDSNLTRLYDHLAWADQAMLAALDEAGDPNEEARALLAHIVSAEHIWLCRIQSRPLGRTTAWSHLSLSECRALSAEVVSGYRTLIQSTPESALNASITYRSLQGAEFQTPLREILLHVAIHGAYHRGQMAAVLRRSGLEPASTDFILFSRQSPLPLGPA
ncbi:MAG: DinB family protein [Acidobacteria bacterium]|nr:DinB family protein [Acidobacteriota bacterium]MBI3489856.1 DinB family protein [Acidobacteriota bacterium]